MRIAMKRKSCLTMTPSFCCSLLPRTVCHFTLERDVMEGTLARDRDHKEEEISETTCRFRTGFSSTAIRRGGAVWVLRSSLGWVAKYVRGAFKTSQFRRGGWLCHSNLYLPGGVCVLSTTFS